MTPPPPDPALVARARSLVAGGQRALLGITGPPGAGKSTLAEGLVAALGPQTAVLVGMDGFHLAQAELERLGRAGRKGAPDTFDAAGYVALLRRLREAVAGETVYAPEFRRAIEEPVACAIPVAPTVPLVVTEGNYLLLDGPWAPVRELLDEAWYCDVADSERLGRLVDRHAAFGKPREAAEAWARGSDQANADVITPTRGRADLVIDSGG